MFYAKPIISLSLDNHRFIGTGHDIQKSDYISSWPSCGNRYVIIVYKLSMTFSWICTNFHDL
jgi:hypothetical protein